MEANKNFEKLGKPVNKVIVLPPRPFSTLALTLMIILTLCQIVHSLAVVNLEFDLDN